MAQPTDPLHQAYAAYEQFESRLSTAMDHLVATNGFAEVFTTSASTVLAITRIVNHTIDEAVRVTRLAARHDVTALARQLARTENKLERVLQMVEDISDRLEEIEVGSETGSPVSADGPDGADGRGPRDGGATPSRRARAARDTRSGRSVAARSAAGRAQGESS